MVEEKIFLHNLGIEENLKRRDKFSHLASLARESGLGWMQFYSAALVLDSGERIGLWPMGIGVEKKRASPFFASFILYIIFKHLRKRKSNSQCKYLYWRFLDDASK